VSVFAIKIRGRHPSPGDKTEASHLVKQTTETIQIPLDDAYVTICSLFNIHDYFSPHNLALKSLELNSYPLNVPSASSNNPSVSTPQLHPQGCSINQCKESYKDKAVPLQAWTGPEDSRKLRFPDFVTTAQDGGKVVSLTH